MQNLGFFLKSKQTYHQTPKKKEKKKEKGKKKEKKNLKSKETVSFCSAFCHKGSLSRIITG